MIANFMLVTVMFCSKRKIFQLKIYKIFMFLLQILRSIFFIKLISYFVYSACIVYTYTTLHYTTLLCIGHPRPSLTDVLKITWWPDILYLANILSFMWQKGPSKQIEFLNNISQQKQCLLFERFKKNQITFFTLSSFNILLSTFYSAGT